jgi:short subunit dehydrogenase-like uncharacterized protein
MAGHRGSREYDLVIFGATGFTGARVLQYACSVAKDRYANTKP